LNRDKRAAYEQLYKGIDELRRKYGEMPSARLHHAIVLVDFTFKAPYRSDN
jgi:hypothetical protein